MKQAGCGIYGGQTQQSGETWSPGLKARFNVAILYETVEDGKRAKRFSDQVATEVDDGYDIAININIWSFQVLRSPETFCLAACAAAAADMIIIAGTGTKKLPAQVNDWFQTWTSLVNRRHPIVVVLFAQPVEENASIRAALRRSVMRRGIDCFTQTDRGAAGIRYGERIQPESHFCLLGETRSTAGNSRSADVVSSP